MATEVQVIFHSSDLRISGFSQANQSLELRRSDSKAHGPNITPIQGSKKICRDKRELKIKKKKSSDLVSHLHKNPKSVGTLQSSFRSSRFSTAGSRSIASAGMGGNAVCTLSSWVGICFSESLPAGASLISSSGLRGRSLLPKNPIASAGVGVRLGVERAELGFLDPRRRARVL